MDLQPLTKAVLNPFLAEKLQEPSDVSGLSLLPYWTFVASANELTAQLNTMFSPTYTRPATPDTRALGIVTSAMMSLPTNVTNVTDILEVFRKSGMDVFYAQLEAISGARATQFLRNYIDPAVADLSRVLPLAAVPPCADVTGQTCSKLPVITSDFAEFTAQATEYVTTRLKDALGEQQTEYLLPAESLAVAMMKVGLGPWLMMRFITTFNHGSWNAVQRDDVSFYDQRYSLLLLYSTIVNVLSDVSMLNRKMQGNDEIVTALTAYMNAIVTHMVSSSETDVGGEAMMHMYRTVADLSNDSKDASVQVDAATKRFELRRDYTTSLRGNLTSDETQLNTARRRFYVWVAAYVVAVAIAAALVATGQFPIFKLQAGLVLLVVTIYLLALVVRAYIRTS